MRNPSPITQSASKIWSNIGKAILIWMVLRSFNVLWGIWKGFNEFCLKPYSSPIAFFLMGKQNAILKAPIKKFSIRFLVSLWLLNEGFWWYRKLNSSSLILFSWFFFSFQVIALLFFLWLWFWCLSLWVLSLSSYGLEICFRKKVYEDFERLTLEFYNKGNIYGLEKYW